MSKASIEALIAQRIDEKLAEKALQDATAPAPALSAELQKRLDELEHRIEAKEEDGKAEGLQFLLMAKQHQVRKEEASALRMYQLALPYFPGNEKLKAKMHMLEERIRTKKESESRHILAPLPSASSNAVPPTLALPPSSALMAPLKVEKKQSKQKIVYKDDEEEEEEEFAPVVVSDHDSSFASDASFLYKPKASRKPKKAAKRLPIFRDDAEPENHSASQPGEQTPRTARLLKIINSRDVHQIKALKGVGAKKADAIVSCLIEMDSDEVHDLESLALLKGVSGKTVENMRTGLGVGIGGFWVRGRPVSVRWIFGRICEEQWGVRTG
jgi:DNA uptake protein ComE-like DNA-binding protein